MTPSEDSRHFQKLDLRVGKIVEAEKVEGSEKLIKLKVDIGGEERQLVAGIGKNYSPEDLIEKEIIVVANLEPKVLFGIESQGMLLAAEDGDTISLLMPDKEVKPGSRVC